MKIPDRTKKPRFYVAYSMTHAFSSWDTLAQAHACVRRFKKLGSADADRLFLIIQTGQHDAVGHALEK